MELVKVSQLDEIFKLLITDTDRNVRAVDVDANENVINFENGLLWVDTLTLELHTPDILSTIQLSCNWQPSAVSSPVFNRFISSLTSNNKEMSNLIWAYIGLVLSNIPGYMPKKSLFLYGPGDTGKSRLPELLMRILGENNCTAIDLKSLEERFGSASLWRKRLACAADMSSASIRELATFKSITGGDKIEYEYKGKDKFSAQYRGLFLFCANALPEFGGDKGRHVYDRMLLIKCANVIPENKRDVKIVDKMYIEREAIVLHAIMALKRFISNGYRFAEPRALALEREEYKVKNDTVREFISECTTPYIQGGKHPRVAEVYEMYCKWSKNSNYTAEKKSRFRDSLVEIYNVTDHKELTSKVNGNEFYNRFQIKPAYYNPIFPYSY